MNKDSLRLPKIPEGSPASETQRPRSMGPPYMGTFPEYGIRGPFQASLDSPKTDRGLGPTESPLSWVLTDLRPYNYNYLLSPLPL